MYTWLHPQLAGLGTYCRTFVSCSENLDSRWHIFLQQVITWFWWSWHDNADASFPVTLTSKMKPSNTLIRSSDSLLGLKISTRLLTPLAHIIWTICLRCETWTGPRFEPGEVTWGINSFQRQSPEDHDFIALNDIPYFWLISSKSPGAKISNIQVPAMQCYAHSTW